MTLFKLRFSNFRQETSFGVPMANENNVWLDNIHTMPTDIDCLELGMPYTQTRELQTGQFTQMAQTKILWRAVLNHINSVKLIRIGLVPTELIQILEEFQVEKRNSVTKLVFKQYAGPFTKWSCSLCEIFQNVNAMHFEFSNIRNLNFDACEGKQISYSADQFSKDKAKYEGQDILIKAKTITGTTN